MNCMFPRNRPRPLLHPSIAPMPLPPPPAIRPVPARRIEEGSLLVVEDQWREVVHVDGHDLVRVAWVSFDGDEGSTVFAGSELVTVAVGSESHGS